MGHIAPLGVIVLGCVLGAVTGLLAWPAIRILRRTRRV